MTTITLPRATVEQALEAMRCAVPTGKITLADWHKSIAELEAVLAQQVKHVAWANIDSDRLRVDPATGNVSIGAQQAEPVEPVAWMVYTEGGASAYVTDNPCDLIGAYRALPLYTAPPQQAEPVEPVAWVRLEAWKSGKDWPDDCFTALPAEGLTPVYTAPPQRKPLTDEDAAALIELDPRMLKEFGTAPSGAAMELIRRTERAHGIGGQE